ncbi:dTDP-4-dehydrorhamnose 3,5-epimerase family protein [Pelagibacteraceae bacterium]|nr:dTDP-4-dehydrorhamnose 3,5-epimerase family protein [Pelagibacteraceae bacterium]
MSKIKIVKTKFKNLYLLKPKGYVDRRGSFSRLYCSYELEKIIKKKIKQINLSFFKKSGVMRGLHYQTGNKKECKIIYCVKGEVYDIALDLRLKSKTYRKYFKTKLSEKKHMLVLIPEGFAHGVISLKKNSQIIYFSTNYYSKKSERIINVNDPGLNIKLPTKIKIISKKDQNSKFLFNK